VTVKVKPWVVHAHLRMETNTRDMKMVNPFMVVHPQVKMNMEPWVACVHLWMETNTQNVKMVIPPMVIYP